MSKFKRYFSSKHSTKRFLFLKTRLEIANLLRRSFSRSLAKGVSPNEYAISRCFHSNAIHPSVYSSACVYTSIYRRNSHSVKMFMVFFYDPFVRYIVCHLMQRNGFLIIGKRDRRRSFVFVIPNNTIFRRAHNK